MNLGRAFNNLAGYFGFTRDARDTSGGESRSGTPLSAFVLGTGNDAGVAVTADTAMTHAAVWRCVTAISEAFATLPVHVKHRNGGSKAEGHRVHALMHDTPNEYMTPAVFRSCMMVNALLHGRAIAVIDRDEMARPAALYPVPTADTRVERHNGLLRYYVRLAGRNEWVSLRPDEVLDILWMTDDGVTALSPIQYARNTMGLSLAVQQYAAKFFANGGNLGGLLKLPPGMDDDAVKAFIKSWRTNYTGAKNSYKLAPIPAGMEFQQLGTDPEKGQMLDTRDHQVLEICRIFGVPPHKVFDLSRATWANIEHSQIEWAQGTLLPWTVRWEQEADRKLLLQRERPTLETKFNLDAVLRADSETRTRTLAAEIASGMRTINEARRVLDLPPVEGGDTPLRPANTVPLTHLVMEPTDEPNDQAA